MAHKVLKKTLRLQSEARERQARGAGKTEPWSQETREQAIAFAMRCGSFAAAQRKFGIPSSTIRGWFARMRAGDEDEEVRSLRTSARMRAIEMAWEGLHRLLEKLNRRLDSEEDGKRLPMPTEDLIQAVERLSRTVDNLGSVMHTSKLLEGAAGTPDQRRAEAQALDAFEDAHPPAPAQKV